MESPLADLGWMPPPSKFLKLSILLRIHLVPPEALLHTETLSPSVLTPLLEDPQPVGKTTVSVITSVRLFLDIQDKEHNQNHVSSESKLIDFLITDILGHKFQQTLFYGKSGEKEYITVIAGVFLKSKHLNKLFV